MIVKLYTVRNIKRDVFNPPFVLEDEKFLKDVILQALVNAKVDPQDLKDFEVHYLSDFDNTTGFINFNSELAQVLECVDLKDSYVHMLSDEYIGKSAIKLQSNGGDQNA